MRFQIKSYEVINRNDCINLLAMLQKHPISVGVTGRNLNFYEKGTFDGCNPNG